MSKIEEKIYHHIITKSIRNLCETDSTPEVLKNSIIFGSEIFEKVQNSTEPLFGETFIYNNGKWEDIELSGYIFSKIASIEHSDHYY